MKNTEALVTDLETSKQLQEAGIIKYDTAFVWVEYASGKIRLVLKSFYEKHMGDALHRLIPAFTACELMQVLPYKIDAKDKPEGYLDFFKNEKSEYVVSYKGLESHLVFYIEKCFEKALSKLCLWCKKEGYL